AREALEERQHGLSCVVVVTERVDAFEVAFLRYHRPLPIFDGDAPLTAPRPVDLKAVREVEALGVLLIHRVLPEHKRKWQDQARGGFFDRGQLVAETVLDVVRVDAVVHDLERAVEPGRHGARKRVIDHEAGPLLRRQVREHLVELLRVLLEAVERLLAWELAKFEGVVVQRLPHHREAEGGALLAGDSGLPVREVTLDYIDHATYE